MDDARDITLLTKAPSTSLHRDALELGTREYDEPQRLMIRMQVSIVVPVMSASS